MSEKYQPIMHSDYGPLDPKVNLLPDFFTGFEASRRSEIVAKEAAFYHKITQPFSLEDQIEKTDVVFSARDGFEIPVRFYRPKNCRECLPVVMFFHGGGFMTCSLETHDYVPTYLAAKAHIAVCSVEYRLAPEYKFPTGLEDCYDACKWVRRESQRFQIDPHRMAVGGDSSGGNFAAAITLMAKKRKDFPLWKQILIYPVTELTGTVKRRAPEVYAPVGGVSEGLSPMLSAYLPDPEQDTKNPLVSPLLAHDLSGLPPALCIIAECDALSDDGLIYAKLLQDSGVSVECHLYQGMPHAFILRTYEESFQALDCICDYLKQ